MSRLDIITQEEYWVEAINGWLYNSQNKSEWAKEIVSEIKGALKLANEVKKPTETHSHIGGVVCCYSCGDELSKDEIDVDENKGSDNKICFNCYLVAEHKH